MSYMLTDAHKNDNSHIYEIEYRAYLSKKEAVVNKALIDAERLVSDSISGIIYNYTYQTNNR